MSEVVRISTEAYERLKAKKLPKQTYGDFIIALLDLAENLVADPIYLSGDKAFSSLLDARGNSILEAVKAQRQPYPVQIAMLTGIDEI